MVDIHQLMAALNPEVYCDAATRREVKRMLKEGKARGDATALLAAAEKARLVEPNAVDTEHLEQENPFRLPACQRPPAKPEA